MTDNSIFPHISKPGRYLGQEFNSIQKNWQECSVRCAFVFPDLYEIGMSHQGLQILYHIINAKNDFLAERCYCPNTDVEKLLREKQHPLTSLESEKPLADFDIVGITLPYELCYANILTVLDLANIPFEAKDRQDTFPLLIAGGAGAFNPEPVAEIFDAIILGDGEDSMLEVANVVKDGKLKCLSKDEILIELAKLDGLYIPKHFTPQYDDTGKIINIKSSGPKKTVLKAFLKSFEETAHLTKPLVPNAKIIHDRLAIEIARGCTRGCRFCQAGITYRPVRERSAKEIKKLAIEAIADSGFDELALLSLSTGDYSCLDSLLPELMNEFSDKFVSVAMPSMRVGTLSPTIMDEIKRVRKTGFTLAPEAGSERLRRVINKGITEEDLLNTCKEAFSLGWTTMKLYFMIGLPTETDEDLEAMADLTNKVRRFREVGGNVRKSQVNISVGTFVPKPHTPFQWAAQMSLEESKRRIQLLKKLLPKKGCNFKWHTPEQSFLEGVFSRGDRRLLPVLIEAWNQGARLDGWSESFNYARWITAAETCQVNLDEYLRERDLEEVLPWQHLETGVSMEFLKRELENSIKEAYTPDCRYHKCSKCGVCDMETISPIVHNKRKFLDEIEVKERKVVEKKVSNNHHKYIIHYSRHGRICYLGHLEILQVVFRALRRAGIETHFSQGYNPSPKVSFGPALSVGTESMAEYFMIDLPHPLADIKATAEKIGSNLPPGMELMGLENSNGKIPQDIVTKYQITLPNELTGDSNKNIEDFLATNEFFWTRSRKGKTSQIDIRPMIPAFSIINENTVEIDHITRASQPGIKTIEAICNILKISDEDRPKLKILKLSWKDI
ncbi:MAG: TIGR03960 family B12-binding radical SAM protein [Desulfotalea sp.]